MPFLFGRRGNAVVANPAAASASETNGLLVATPNRRRPLHHSRAAEEAAASFHPKLITTQIIAIQCLHYALLAFFIQINAVFYGSNVTMDRIFTDTYIRVWHARGWPDVLAVLLASLAGSVLLALIVEKTKKCLDFGFTLFLIHLLACILYNGFPTVLDWWIVHVFGMICTVLLGEYLCSRRELDDIPLLAI
jgi:hypothetical protein